MKSIYKITNQINGKIYIGQSIDPQRRFSEHCINYGKKNGKDDRNSLINLAIRKYGKENFQLEILEKDIENYNEREIYWIEYYNTISPNGYNLAFGGEGHNGLIGENSPTAHHNNKEIEEIKYLIEFSNMSFVDIAKKFNYKGHSSISDINEGKIWRDKNRKYPIRKTNCAKNLSPDKIQEIINELLTTTKTQDEIAKEYNIGRHVVTAINIGESYKQESLNYPLRENKKKKSKNFSEQDIQKIIEKIKFTKDSFTKIAKEFDCSIAAISNINSGKSHKQLNQEYPIRKTRKK